MLKNQNILITGGLGFIFSYVSEYFSNHNNVTVIDNLSDGSHPELIASWDNIKVIQDDINNLPNLLNKLPQFNTIIHAAAESNVDKSIKEPSFFLQSNIMGTYQILEFAKKTESKVLYINTDEIYSSTHHWCTVNNKLNPTNPYSASKAGAGHLCWAYHNTYGLPVQEVRMCNIVGKRQAATKLLPKLIKAVQNNEEMPLYDGGQQTREYMDVRDVPPLLEQVLLSDESIINLTFNQELSTLEVIKIVENVLGKKANIIPATRLGHDAHYRMTPSKVIYDYVQHKKKNIAFEETVTWMVDN